MPSPVQTLIESDCCDSFSFTERRWIDTGYQNEESLLAVRGLFQSIPRNLGNRRTLQNQVAASKSELIRHLFDWANFRSSSDIEVTVHRSFGQQKRLETFIAENSERATVQPPAYWGIAGYPIAHSLTPRLFEIVGERVGLDGAQCVFVEADSIEEFIANIERLDGDLWLSCTAPLKHSPQARLRVSGPEGVNAINQLKRTNGVWSGTSTDGLGFVAACQHIGLEPNGSVLRMRGGGSAARAIAAAWAAEGGRIIPIAGRRALLSGPWDEAIIDGEEAKVVEANLAIDLDAAAGGGESVDLPAKRQVSISYGEDATIDDFAVIMVAAQHLEAWKHLYAPALADSLPSLAAVLEALDA